MRHVVWKERAALWMLKLVNDLVFKSIEFEKFWNLSRLNGCLLVDH